MVKAAPVSAAAGAAAHAKPGQPVKVEALAKTGKPADKKLQAAALQSSKLPSKKQAKQQSKPVRDSFTMPQADFDLIAALKFRGLSLGRSIKKSELLRAGLLALSVFNDKALLSTLDKLEPVKMGRPKTGAASA